MKDLIQKIKKIFNTKRTPKISFEKKGINPSRDWSIVLFVFLIIIVALGGISYFLYLKINNGTFIKIDEENFESNVKINSTLLKKVIDDVNLREKLFEEVKIGKNVPPNPAL